MSIIRVTCALIVNEHKQVLVTQRSASMRLPLKWEFPGGKIERGETPENCLIREIKEELNLNITIHKALPSNVHHYADESIELFPFLAQITSGEIILNQHAQYNWTDKSELLSFDWAEADVPIVENFLTVTDGSY